MQNSFSDAGALVGTVLGILLTISLWGSMYNHKTNNIKFYQELDSCINSGYSIFIDGVEVSTDNISINKYDKDKIVIDDTNNKILISTNSSSRY